MTSAGEAIRLQDDVDAGLAVRVDLPKTVIRRQMNQAGNILLTAIEPFSDDEFFADGLNGISAAWTLGHLACVMDLFTQWIEERELLIPDWMHNIFNSLEIEHPTKTKAASVDRLALPKQDVLLLFRNTQVRTLKLLRDFDMESWEDRTLPHAPESLPTYGAIWQNLGVHTFWHLGELCAALPRFHNTHSLNTLAHYFYFRQSKPALRSGMFSTAKEQG
jgi:hypothetical protein